MDRNTIQTRNRAFVLAGLGIALLIALLVSPFASKDPDGLDRVSKDHKFEDKAQDDTPAKKLPFYQVFEEYEMRGVPDPLKTPLAGLVGTLTAFGLAWGLGKLAIRNTQPPIDEPPIDE